MQSEFFETSLLFFIFLGICIIFIYWIIKLNEERRFRLKVQRDLKLSEEKYRTLFEISPILMNSFDKNGKILLWNKECEKVFGWSFEELKEFDKPLSLFYDDAKTRKDLLSKFTKSHGVYETWYPKRKDGKTLVVKWANIKLQNNEVICIGHDITEETENKGLLEQNTLTLEFTKKKLETLNMNLESRIKNEIEKSTKQQALMLEQSKFVQMGEMIQNIAHQWRQPLSEINSTLLLIDGYLNSRDIMDDKIDEKLSQIENLTSYLSHTISDFQNFFDPNRQKESFKINDAVLKSLNIAKGRVEDLKIEIINNIDEKIEFFGQKEQLQQVFLVIINNAIDAIKINQIINPKIIFSLFKENDNLIIKISDNALGVDEKIITRIFEPYFTTKYKSKGTGIGLYMAKMIIQNSFEGDIFVENISNGVEFSIKIGGVKSD